MQRVVRLIIIAAAASLVLAATLIFLLLNTPQAASESVTFKAMEPTDVSGVTVSNSFGSYTVSAKDGGYVVADIPAELVDLDAFVDFMTQCGTVGALKRVAARPSDLSEYGLDEPAAAVSVTYSDNSVLNLRIGKADPVSGNYYMQVDDKDGVYLLSADSAACFICDKENYIDHSVTPALAVSSPLSAIQDVSFSGTALSEPITIDAVGGENEDASLAALSFGAVTHLVRGKGVYELDQTYGIEILGSILGMEARDVVGYGMSEAEIAAFGFDNPYMRVEFDLKNGTDTSEHCILSLIRQGEDSFLAHLSGSSAVYEIARPAFVDIQYEKLILRWFLSPLLMDLSGLTVSTPAQTLNFTVNSDENKNLQAALNGTEMDIELFRSFYRLVTSASAADRVYPADSVSGGEPLMTITYHYLNGNKADDVMKLYNATARRVYVEVNGIIEFDMKESFYTYMLSACKNVLIAKTFDENW